MLLHECDDCQDVSKRELFMEAQEYLLDYDENEDRRLSYEEFEELYDDFMGEDDSDDDSEDDWWNNYAQI